MSAPAPFAHAFHGPRKGADRAVLLAHGAGSDMHAPSVTTVCEALASAGVPAMRFNFPYKTAGKRSPDRAPVLEAATRDAVARLARHVGLPAERLVLGGRSMGGRYGSLVAGHAADAVAALGLTLLGYPLHPAGKPDQLRVEHFPRLTMPVLFVSGTRDALAPVDSLQREAKAIPGPVSFHWLDTADHGFRPLKASGKSPADAYDEAADAVVEFVLDLPG